jgi:hypothetical protein
LLSLFYSFLCQLSKRPKELLYSYAYKILVGKPEGKRPLGRPRCRWEAILKWILGNYGLVVKIELIWHYAYTISVGKPEGKRPLGRPRCRWEANIKMDLRELGFGGEDWINLAHSKN